MPDIRGFVKRERFWFIMVPFLGAQFYAWYLIQGMELTKKPEPVNPFALMEPKEYIEKVYGKTDDNSSKKDKA